jgi:long-chain fatty acid transport protein
VITSASLPLLDIKPTLAYRVSDWLALGLGADIFTFAGFIGEGHVEQQFVWPGGLSIPPGTPVEVNGSGTTAGMNASLLATPIRNDQGQPLLNVGAVWRSQAVVPLTGELRANGALVADLQSSLRLPEMYHVAIAGWPVRSQDREWKFEADVDFVRWQSIQESNLSLSNGVTLSAPQRLHNAVSIAFGTEHKWVQIEGFNGWSVALRGGYIWSQRAYSAFSFHPRIPDSNSHSLSTGIGLMCGQGGTFLGLINCSTQSEAGIHLRGIGLDFAYQSIFDETRAIAGNLNPTLDGTYRSSLQVGAVTFRLLF